MLVRFKNSLINLDNVLYFQKNGENTVIRFNANERTLFLSHEDAEALMKLLFDKKLAIDLND